MIDPLAGTAVHKFRLFQLISVVGKMMYNNQMMITFYKRVLSLYEVQNNILLTEHICHM